MTAGVNGLVGPLLDAGLGGGVPVTSGGSLVAEKSSDEDWCGGEAGEVSPWYELCGSVGCEAQVRTFERASADDDYRDVVPGVDYMAGFRDGRAVEAELLAMFRELLNGGGVWVRTEKLVTRLGVGALRVDMPAFAWREGLSLMRDGARYRSLKPGHDPASAN